MKIGIFGCAGRMGQKLVKDVLASDKCSLSGGCEIPGHSSIGMDLANLVGLSPCGLTVTENSSQIFIDSDVVIDFTIPDNISTILSLAIKHKTNLVIGTTGHSEKQIRAIKAASNDLVLVKSMNFSLGINVLFSLAETTSKVLGDEYDIEIVEMHHKNKIDSPSGTALGLGQHVADGREINLEDSSYFNLPDNSNRRINGKIGFASLRGGDVIGDHKVIFAGPSERIELGHIASSRELFSKGAVQAAVWTKNRNSGLYSMLDVLGLQKT